MQVITKKDKMTSRPSRNLMNVIENSLKIIPSTETDLIEKLKWILNSCCYTAPDVMYIRWNEFMAALNEYLPSKPETEWQENLQKFINEDSFNL